MSNITARDVATILGENPFETPFQCLVSKMEKKWVGTNEAMAHGIKWETEALHQYCTATGNTVETRSNMKHETWEWLTGRIDGMTANHAIVEVKCPSKPRGYPLTGETVPRHYWVQIQVYMEMTNSEIGHYVEFNISKGEDDPSKGILEWVPIVRDRKWWASVLPIVCHFHDEVVAWKAKGSLDTHPVRVAERAWQLSVTSS